jgi:hypothetical protein
MLMVPLGGMFAIILAFAVGDIGMTVGLFLGGGLSVCCFVLGFLAGLLGAKTCRVCGHLSSRRDRSGPPS